MYEENLLKAKAYKDMIKKALLEQGQYPNKAAIQGLVDQIDMRYAILDHKYIQQGNDFDIDQANSELLCLYTDLVILYETVYKLETEKFVALQSFVNGYLTSLEETAAKCAQKTRLQTNNTSLGKTIFFQASGCQVIYDGDKASIMLGQVTAEAVSELSCYIVGDGFDQENVVFRFRQDGEVLSCSPYSVDGSMLTTGGTIKTERYEYQMDDNVGHAMYQVPGIQAKDGNHYYGFAGRNMILHYGAGVNGLAVKNSGVPYYIKAKSNIKFHVINATYLNMEFSKEPISKNFSSYTMTSLPVSAEISFTADANTNFDFDTDGEVYAERMTINVLNDAVYVTQYTYARDLVVFEQEPGQSQEYSVVVDIYNSDYSLFHIDSIAIKELTSIKKILKVGT